MVSSKLEFQASEHGVSAATTCVTNVWPRIPLPFRFGDPPPVVFRIKPILYLSWNDYEVFDGIFDVSAGNDVVRIIVYRMKLGNFFAPITVNVEKFMRKPPNVLGFGAV